MNSQRLLHAMHKVVHHDLPNQIVALRSLLQLLNHEESSRLSEDGREYLRRLQNAAQRAGDMARFLKEIERLASFAVKPTTIVLADLARELQCELQQRHPAQRVEFACHWHVPQIVGDPRVYAQALRELFAGLLPTRGKRCALSAASHQRDDAVELCFTLEETASPAPALDERMEVILAREWLALAGADLRWTAPLHASVGFSFLLPSH